MGLRMDIFSSAWTSSISPFSAQLSAQTKKDGRTRWSMMVLVPHTDSKPFSLLSQSFHLLWYFGGCESLVKLATRRDEDDTKAASYYYYTFSLLSFCLGDQRQKISQRVKDHFLLLYTALKLVFGVSHKSDFEIYWKVKSNVCFRITWYEFEALKDSSNNFWKAEVEKFEPQVENGRERFEELAVQHVLLKSALRRPQDLLDIIFRQEYICFLHPTWFSGE